MRSRLGGTSLTEASAARSSGVVRRMGLDPVDAALVRLSSNAVFPAHGSGDRPIAGDETSVGDVRR